MPILIETLWRVSGPVTVWRLAELVLFAVAAWFCFRKNGRAAVEMVCIAWTVAALDGVREIINSFTVISGPLRLPDPFEIVVHLLACFPLPCLMTIAVILFSPKGRLAASLSWSAKAMIAIPLIAVLDLLLFGVILLPTLFP